MRRFGDRFLPASRQDRTSPRKIRAGDDTTRGQLGSLYPGRSNLIGVPVIGLYTIARDAAPARTDKARDFRRAALMFI